jgi:hypothetical protein
MPTSPASNAIITLEQAQTLMNDKSTQNESYFQDCINVLSGVFDSICYPDGKHQLISKTYTEEICDGTGTDMMFLPAWNVTAISKVEIRTDKSSWETVDSSYHEIDSFASGVAGWGYTFHKRRGWYRVTYTAGWEQSAMPGAIVDAFYAEFPRLAERRRDIQSNSFGGQATASTTYRDVRKDTMEALFPFRKDLMG